ncbi:Hypothetical predicted protein [Mytilus galloprovincialis]|uniref:Fucolectin tachylectin-4 pentraxin-1 domain-containing protein n=1 Tax=Mytilus galloprovincialis TaxID=29158 RepID=A0A8B6D1C1_MYTGA|nr:Hypothetical predicted protein [Mytilus galloprovincialis]
MFLLLNSYTSPDNDLFGLGITLKSILGLKCIYVKRLSPPLNSFDLHYFLNNALRENIALNKDTLQSSTTTAEANRQAKSSLANDGSSEQNYKAPGGPFCSHTLADEANYWWALDLGQEYNINTMTIYNRKDCCGE